MECCSGGSRSLGAVLAVLATVAAVLLLARPGPPPAAVTEQGPSAAERFHPGSAAGARVPLVADASGVAPAVIRGRCVTRENGLPLAGCTVSVASRAATGAGAAQEPVSITSGADGSFELRFTPPPECAHDVRIALADRVPFGRRWMHLRPGVTIDLGLVRLHRGHPLHGLVVDERGVPAAGVRVPARPGHGAMREATTDAGGRFAFTDPFPAGTHDFHLRAVELQLVGPAVVDPSGAPVPRVHVTASAGEEPRTLASAWSDAAGAFAFALPSGDPVRLDTSRRAAEGGAERWFRPGEEARLVVLPPLVADLQVTRAGTGEPVTGFTWSSDAGRGGGGTGSRARLPFDEPGEHALIVWPTDPRLAPCTPQRFTVADGAVPVVHVALQEKVPVLVSVVHADDTPVAGADVELLWNAGGGDVLLRRAETPPGSLQRDGTLRAPVLLLQETTDADGHARLLVPPGRDDLVLRASGRSHATVVLPLQRSPASVRLVVPAGARVHGSVTPSAWIAPSAAAGGRPLLLARTAADGEGWRRTNTRHAAPLGDDGTFDLRGLPAGECVLYLAHVVPGGVCSTWRPLAELALRADEARALQLDVDAHRPGTIGGVMRLDGEPLAGAEVEVVAFEQGYTSCRTDASGCFMTPPLPPGTYNVRVRNGASRLADERWLELLPGARLERAFDLVARRVRPTPTGGCRWRPLLRAGTRCCSSAGGVPCGSTCRGAAEVSSRWTPRRRSR